MDFGWVINHLMTVAMWAAAGVGVIFVLLVIGHFWAEGRRMKRHGPRRTIGR